MQTALVYRSLILIALLPLLLPGCAQMSTTQQRRLIPTEVRVDGPNEGRPTLVMPIALPDSSVMLVPFTLDRRKRWLEDADQFKAARDTMLSQAALSPYDAQRYGFGGIGMTQSVRWHNAVLRDLKHNKARLVLDQRGVISRFEIAGAWTGEDDHRRFDPKALLFHATIEDSDGDGELTSADAVRLLAGDADGDGLHAITPPGTQVWGTRYNAEHNLILMMVSRDTDGDGLFTEADSAAPYVYTPGDPGEATPLIAPSLSDQAERLLTRP